MSQSFQKRRKPNYNFRSNKKRDFVLKAGLKGFLCTCNAHEGDCIREAYNILNEYSEKLQAEGSGENEKEEATVDHEAADSEEDVDTALEKEISSLKDEANKMPRQRKFQVVESGAKNCLFIQTTVPDPVQLVLSIVEDLSNTKAQKCRFLQRLLPIETTCRATLEDVRAALEPLLDKYFAKESKTFSIMFTRRNSSALTREEVIENLAEMVTLKNTGNRADLKAPQLSIMVEVMRGICCLAVLPDYFKFKKYNLLELTAPEKSEGDGGDSKERDDMVVTEAQNVGSDQGDGIDSKKGDGMVVMDVRSVDPREGNDDEGGDRD